MIFWIRALMLKIRAVKVNVILNKFLYIHIYNKNEFDSNNIRFIC